MRMIFVSRVEVIGQQLNALRMDLLTAEYTFTAGIIRAAEEALLLVANLLNDGAVSEDEL
jgi:hypothetical protein